MSTCKDCIHYEICEIMSDQYGISKVPSCQCGFYKNTADVVEVVRCKDCRYCEEHHYEEEGENPYIKLGCKWSNYSHQPNDYCSLGERRSENEG